MLEVFIQIKIVSMKAFRFTRGCVSRKLDLVKKSQNFSKQNLNEEMEFSLRYLNTLTKNHNEKCGF